MFGARWVRVGEIGPAKGGGVSLWQWWEGEGGRTGRVLVGVGVSVGVVRLGICGGRCAQLAQLGERERGDGSWGVLGQLVLGLLILDLDDLHNHIVKHRDPLANGSAAAKLLNTLLPYRPETVRRKASS